MQKSVLISTISVLLYVKHYKAIYIQFVFYFMIENIYPICILFYDWKKKKIYIYIYIYICVCVCVCVCVCEYRSYLFEHQAAHNYYAKFHSSRN